MNKGIIYILINPSMPGYVKIGKTSNLERRLKQLDNSSVPVPFQCAYAAEVSSYEKVEKLLHDAFADARSRSRREFFEVDEQRVISALRIAKGKNVTPKKDVTEDEESSRVLEKTSERRRRFKFSLVKLKKGAEITYLKDPSIKAVVVSDTQIELDGERLSLSVAAHQLLKRDGYNWKTVQGPQFWEYDGETLSQRRRRMEEE